MRQFIFDIVLVCDQALQRRVPVRSPDSSSSSSTRTRSAARCCSRHVIPVCPVTAVADL